MDTKNRETLDFTSADRKDTALQHAMEVLYSQTLELDRVRQVNAQQAILIADQANKIAKLEGDLNAANRWLETKTYLINRYEQTIYELSAALRCANHGWATAASSVMRLVDTGEMLVKQNYAKSEQLNKAYTEIDRLKSNHLKTIIGSIVGSLLTSIVMILIFVAFYFGAFQVAQPVKDVSYRFFCAAFHNYPFAQDFCKPIFPIQSQANPTLDSNFAPAVPSATPTPTPTIVNNEIPPFGDVNYSLSIVLPENMSLGYPMRYDEMHRQLVYIDRNSDDKHSAAIWWKFLNSVRAVKTDANCNFTLPRDFEPLTNGTMYYAVRLTPGSSMIVTRNPNCGVRDINELLGN